MKPSPAAREENARGTERVDAVRFAVVRALGRVGHEGGFAAATEDFFSKAGMSALDRAFFQEISYGVLRHRSLVDRVVAAFLKGDIQTLPVAVLNILRSGAYQLIFMDRVPASAAVNESVKIAKKLGHAGTAGLVNAVLRKVAGRGREVAAAGEKGVDAPSLARSYSHPEWLVRRWVDRYGWEKAEALLAADNEMPPLTLRGNSIKGSRQELINRLGSEGIAAVATSVSPHGIRVTEGNPFETTTFREGWFSVQDEGAQLVSLLLAPCPEDSVLDLCAAPGGKATHLAELMSDRGRVVAVDNSAQRMQKVSEAVGRLGLGSVAPLVADASLPSLSTVAGEHDKVLADVPCSGLGVLRRHPEARWEKKESDLGRLKARQLAILTNAAACLRPGGVLVYATCSTEPEENMEVVTEFLRGAEGMPEEMKIEPPARFLPDAARVFVREDMYLDTTGNHAGMDDFFAVRLVRRGR